MEYMIFGFVLLALFFLWLIRGVLDEKRRRAAFLKRLYDGYGKPTGKKYPDGRLETIAKHYRKENKEFLIDDITWNDLSMEEVYRQADYTFSAAGEEALYNILRSPCMSEAELLRREELIAYFMAHQEDRVQLQLFFAGMGRTGKYSIYDYISYMDTLGERSNRRHYAMLVLIAAAFLLCFFRLGFGLPALFVLITVNMITYFREKDEIDPYITTFAYFLRVLDTVRRFCGYRIEILEKMQEELAQRADVFRRFSRGAFLLTKKTGGIGGDPLTVVLDYIRMLLHLDLIKFNTMLREATGHKEDMIAIIETLGYVEAMISAGCWRATLPYYTAPEFAGAAGLSSGRGEAELSADRIAAEDKAGRGAASDATRRGGLRLLASDIYHPLLSDPVANNVGIQKGILLTGSNASGKSTFLKTVALSQILSQTLHTACAREYRTSFFRVYTSMALRDDLASGDSYFIVEIKAMKRILDAVRDGGGQVMCFVDEVLRGTNTVERIAASTEILRSISEGGALSFAATHDIELTHLLAGCYENYHFEETVEDGDVKFNYRLMSGEATTRNAIRLLGILGFEEDIISRAEARAADFTAGGEWKL